MCDIPNKSRQSPSLRTIFIAARSRLFHVIRELNLFSDNPFWSSALNHSEQILSTRLFLLLLFFSLLIITTYASLTIRTHHVTLEQFSLADFERLEARYPTTINVRCTHVSNSYRKFFYLSPKFHQICSSSFIKRRWISSLFLHNATSHHILDFRTFTFAQFRALALLCRTARQAVHDAYRTFNSTHLITNHVLSRNHFTEISAVIIDNFRQTLLANEKQMARLVSMTITLNGIVSALGTNYYIHLVPSPRKYVIFNDTYLNENQTSESTCDCRLKENQCSYPAGVFYNWTLLDIGKTIKSNPLPHFQIPGLMAGCLPLESIRQSTLECLYNQSCINILTLQPKISRPKALNVSLSKFSLNATIGSIFDESLFIESWQNTSNFENFFAACKPRLLSYSYEDKFYLSSIFNLCISAFGGLVLACQLVTPGFLKVWNLIKRKKKQTDIELNTMKISSKPISKAVTKHVHRTIYTFNIFSSHNENDPEDERVGIIATRLYILFLLIGLLILGFYTSLVKHTQTHTVSFPSLAEFEKLKHLNLSNLICPCSRFSMSYARIVSIAPRYHQICSSEFLQDYWLSYFDRIELNEDSINFISPDFRVSGQSFFNLIRIFCQTANNTVQNAFHLFQSTRLFTINTLSRSQFNSETRSYLKHFEQQTIASFINLVKLIHTSIHTNHLVTEVWTSAGPESNYDNKTSKWSLHFQPRNFYTNSCSCILSKTCTRPLGFYLQSDNINSQPNVTIPGLVLGCYPVDSVLSSTLECLFKQECIKLFIKMYDFDVVGLVRPLDNRIVNTQSLHDENSRFPPNITIESIVSQLFMENWTASSNFTAYYAHCAPTHCTYSIRRCFDMTYMIAMMLGFYGGLSVILEIILPPIVKSIRQRWHKRDPINSTMAGNEIDSSIPKKKSNLFRKIFQTLQSLNLFSIGSSSINQQMKHQEIVATRIYLFLFTLYIIVAFLYAGPFSTETKTKITEFPTSDIVNDLHTQNISTLSCPCSTAAIHYFKFLSIIPHFHPICYSQYISSSYWSNLSKTNDSVSFQLSAHYRLLSSICQTAERNIKNAQEVFGTRELISIETIPRISFGTHTNALISSFISQIPADYRRMLSFIIGSFRVNQLLNVFTSNWQVDFTNQNEKHLISTYPRRFSVSNCTCAISPNCIEQLDENIVRGCFPFDGFRLSKLENLSMSELNDALFVETWQNKSNYTAYFEICHPLECRSTVRDRNNLLFILTTILGLYGGLTYGLRLIISESLYGYRWWMKNHGQEQTQTISTEPMPI